MLVIFNVFVIGAVIFGALAIASSGSAIDVPSAPGEGSDQNES